MPVFNAEQTLREACDSIVAQTCSDWELIAINDGSADSSRHILESYASHDHRIRILDNPENLGLPASLNRGLDEAKGEYVIRMDGDDICEPHRFERQVNWMAEHADVVLAGSWVKFFGGKTHVRETPENHDELRVRMLLEYPFEHPSLVMRRQFLQDHSIRYNESLRLSEDLELCHRVASLGRVGNIPEPLLRLRQHQGRTHKIQPDALRKGVECVMRMQMKELGLKVDEAMLEIYCSIRERCPVKELTEVRKRTQWFESVLEANRKTLVYPHEALETYLVRVWEDWIREASKQLDGCGKIFRQSRLSRKVKPRWMARWKLAMKLGNSW